MFSFFPAHFLGNPSVGRFLKHNHEQKEYQTELFQQNQKSY